MRCRVLVEGAVLAAPLTTPSRDKGRVLGLITRGELDQRLAILGRQPVAVAIKQFGRDRHGSGRGLAEDGH